MFEVGKVYKVKVESSPGHVGFGRATVLERRGNQLTIQVRTSKDLNANLPKGTRLWFVSDSTETFSGLWASGIIDNQVTGGKAVMVCSPPKLEPLYQRRRTPRVPLDAAVQVWLSDESTIVDVRSRDISRSGIALESTAPLPDDAEPGDHMQMIVQSSVGQIAATARIIRIEKNWLANKTVIGLEFTKLPDESVSTLDKLLVLLGGKPRNPDTAAEEGIKQETGLASWMNAPTETRGRFVGTNSGEQEQTGESAHQDQSDAKPQLSETEINGAADANPGRKTSSQKPDAKKSKEHKDPKRQDPKND